MKAIENRTKAVTAQEITIRKKLDQLAGQGITQYKFPDGIILDEVANKLTADGYDVERWCFADPEESFSMVYFDHAEEGVPGHLYDYDEDDCCNCNCDCDSCCNGNCGCGGCSTDDCESNDDRECDSCTDGDCVCGCTDGDCCCGSYLNGGYGCSCCSTDNS